MSTSWTAMSLPGLPVTMGKKGFALEGGVQPIRPAPPEPTDSGLPPDSPATVPATPAPASFVPPWAITYWATVIRPGVAVPPGWPTEGTPVAAAEVLAASSLAFMYPLIPLSSRAAVRWAYPPGIVLAGSVLSLGTTAFFQIASKIACAPWLASFSSSGAPPWTYGDSFAVAVDSLVPVGSSRPSSTCHITATAAPPAP